MTSQDTNITRENPRNEFLTSPFLDGTQLGRPYQNRQPEELDETSLPLWLNTSSQLADGRLANRHHQASSTQYHLEQNRPVGETDTSWDVSILHDMMNGPQPFSGRGPGIDAPSMVMSGMAGTSSWPSHGFFTIQSGSQLYRASDSLPACSAGAARMNQQQNGARADSRSHKDLSQSWSQISSSLDSSSCDEVFSGMSPLTSYSNGFSCAMRMGTTKPGVWYQNQAQDGLPLDYWWDDGYDATTVLSPNDACPEVSLDDMEFPPLESIWLDDFINDDDHLARSGVGEFLLSSLGEGHDPTLPGMADGVHSTAEGSHLHEYESMGLHNSVPPVKNQSYAPTVNRWPSSITVNLSHHQQIAKDVHGLPSIAEPSGNRQPDQQPQNPEVPSVQRPSRRKHSHQSADHNSGSIPSRTWSARHNNTQRIRVQSKPRSTPRPDAKDIFLVQSKLAGMSYKEIRDRGNFSEAESTLRGRFRTLTKDKENRVRKPEWQERDVRLLVEAVGQVEGKMGLQSTPKNTSKGVNRDHKIPWKQVAEYIAQNGGSYHFGNATCRKKYDEIRKTIHEKDGSVDGGGSGSGGTIGQAGGC